MRRRDLDDGVDRSRPQRWINRPQRLEAGERPVRIRNLTTAIAVAVMAQWATIAAATTYYVSPSGSAANAGTQAAPWSLAKANQSLLAGDVAILAPGTYVTNIAPVNSGSSYSRFIAFVASL